MMCHLVIITVLVGLGAALSTSHGEASELQLKVGSRVKCIVSEGSEKCNLASITIPDLNNRKRVRRCDIMVLA
jgi:hypothetical protein